MLLSGSPYASEIKVVFSNDAGRIESLRTIEKGNISFVSAIGIANLLEARTFYSDSKNKMDITFKKWRLNLSAYSTFPLLYCHSGDH